MVMGDYRVVINRNGNKVVVYYKDKKLATVDLDKLDNMLGGDVNEF